MKILSNSLLHLRRKQIIALTALVLLLCATSVVFARGDNESTKEVKGAAIQEPSITIKNLPESSPTASASNTTIKTVIPTKSADQKVSVTKVQPTSTQISQPTGKPSQPTSTPAPYYYYQPKNTSTPTLSQVTQQPTSTPVPVANPQCGEWKSQSDSLQQQMNGIQATIDSQTSGMSDAQKVDFYVNSSLYGQLQTLRSNFYTLSSTMLQMHCI